MAGTNQFNIEPRVQNRRNKGMFLCDVIIINVRWISLLPAFG